MIASLKYIFLVSFALYVFAVFKVSELPHSAEIKSQLDTDPFQRMLSVKDPYTLEYRGSNYLIEPVADYDISGMIVSHNDIKAFDDIYHTSDSVDIRDLCLAWGENIERDNHLSFNFKNEPWSCHITQKSSDSPGEFRMENLSNNHLLVSSAKLREQIYELHPGDQIRLTGQLINYGHPGEEPFRRTSLVRTDDGNGACEVLFVDNLQVLGRWKPEWWKIRTITAKVSLFLGIATVLSWIIGPIWAYERRKRETELMEANYRKRMGGKG